MFIMLNIRSVFYALLLCPFALVAQAEPNRDCLLEGKIERVGGNGDEEVRVKFHTVSKYSESSRCRIRRDKKMEFRLPDDPRLKGAADGSEVQYRYRTDQDGGASSELINIAS